MQDDAPRDAGRCTTGCRARGASCPTTVEASTAGSNGAGLVLNALGGSVVFESAPSEATDVYKLATDLAAAPETSLASPS